ncbi:MAG: glycyl-radical enzyme activating protein, partial [Christensenellaceae bacterium]
MNQGLVFNIQRFSLHDGNGIRTNIFFKGCPLRCEWCSNPESQSARIEVINDARKCIHCLACVKACENQAISVSKKGAKIDKSLCKNCLSCAKVCPPHALYTEGKWYTVDELIQEALKDKDFFEKSNGGITISGGEPLM